MSTAPSHTQLDKHLLADLKRAIELAQTVILGKGQAIRLAMACLLARGHLLIEDLPGVGKTTLAHLLARLLGLHYSRIQFTSDLLPADILGVSIYNRQSEGFRFHAGPIFAQLVLADEINRATPKAQSALLEAMEERQVTVEGETRLLPQPFFVIATQNPTNQIGTFALPESQLDRFLMRIHLGYPEPALEKALLAGEDRRQLLAQLQPCLQGPQIPRLQQLVERVRVAEPIVDYCQAILSFSRQSNRFVHGLSPRSGLGLLHSARAWALLDEREFVIPEDVQAVLPACLPHRLLTGEEYTESDSADIASYLVESVAVP
jgi:MoxR-like ATPase